MKQARLLAFAVSVLGAGPTLAQEPEACRILGAPEVILSLGLPTSLSRLEFTVEARGRQSLVLQVEGNPNLPRP